MKTMVIGGSGFIGSYLVEYLLAAGDHVTVLDDLSSGRLENLRHVIGHRNFNFVEGAMADRRAVRKAVEGSGRIFHLAGGIGNIRTDERTNLGGALVVLDAACATGATLTVLSSSAFYGENTPDRRSEDADQIPGNSDGGRKGQPGEGGISEALAHAYGKKRGLSVTTVRLPTIVGPRLRAESGGLFRRFVQQAVLGEPLTLYGDGRQVRSLAYVDDVVPAIARLSETGSPSGNIFSLRGAEMTIRDLAARIVEVVGSGSRVTFISNETACGPGYQNVPHMVTDATGPPLLVEFEALTTLDQMILSVAADLAPLAPRDPACWKVVKVGP